MTGGPGPIRPEVLSHYLGNDEAGRLTATMRGRLELARTREVLAAHLPRPPARVLDVGGGPGAHAAWLAGDGFSVMVVDPVGDHVLAARAIPGVAGAVGDARALPVPDASVEVVLLLGPLYHLAERADRVSAWREAARAVVPGGLVAGGAISRFASLLDGLRTGQLADERFRAIVERDLAEGQHRNPDGHPDWFTTAYFHHPDELAPEAAEAGLEPRSPVGLEGPAAWISGPTEPGMDEALLAARAVGQEPTLAGLGPHLLLVARRPG